MTKRSRPGDLNVRQRAFADAYAGPGSGVTAARTAGYTGDGHVLQVTASKLLRHLGIRARIEARLGAAQLEAPPEIAATTEPGLVAGKGRGTQTERLEMLMAEARELRRKRKKTPAERRELRFMIRFAAELEGEIRPSRQGRAAPVLPPLSQPTTTPRAAVATPAAPLRLVVNERDRALEEPARG